MNICIEYLVPTTSVALFYIKWFLLTQSRAYKFLTFEVCCYFVSTRQMALSTGFYQMAFILSFPLIKVYWITDFFFVVWIQLSSIENREFAQCLFLTRKWPYLVTKDKVCGSFHLHSKKVQILVHSHFDLVNSLLALEATELVSQLVTQMALEMINNHLILIQQKR